MKRWTLALVTSLAALGLGGALWREHRANAELTAQSTRLSRQIADLRYEVKQASRQAEAVGQRAVELDSQLGTAKARTTATESKQVQLTRELTETRSRLTEREQREVALLTELETLRQKVAEAAPTETPVMLEPLMVIPVRAKRPPAEPVRATTAAIASEPVPLPAAAPASPPPPPEPAVDVTAYKVRIGELEQQLTLLLTRALAEPGTAGTAPEPEAAPTPASPAPYQVVRVGPHDAFVVLDYGADAGARSGAILDLWRGTSPVARVQISDARPRFSLAQVLPATLKGQLQTGDLVLLTH